MNCLDFMRELNRDPRHLSNAAHGHAQGCPSCARSFARQTEIEAQLARALAIQPPEGLADRILLEVKLRRRHRLQLYALAASVVLVVGASLTLPLLQREHGLPAEMIAHVLREPELLAKRGRASPQELARELARVGAVPMAALPVVHAAPCDVPGGDGGHLVIETPYGRVTMLLVPHRQADNVGKLEKQGFVAVMHTAKRGCYSLIAQNEKALAAAEAMLAKGMRWQA